ncbi:MAG: hypothetical protein LLG14_13100 [Nocardiaceae bacterium]|nr:hypothetical protein [Nocardiaceae bacterium]
MGTNKGARKRPRWIAPTAWLAGIGSAVVLALAVTGTLSGFTASITNNNTNAATGTLIMSESDGTSTCTSNQADGAGVVSTNAYNCSTINKYGGSTTLVPGDTQTKTITITNTGTVTAHNFTLTAGTCTQSNNGTPNGSATDLCAQLLLTVTKTTTGDVFGGAGGQSLNAFTAASPITLNSGTLAAGASVTYTFVLTVPSALDNHYQGLKASQDLTWAFTQ